MHSTTPAGRTPSRAAPRGRATREAILDAAERLFAEHGLDNVSHRQISAAAGQGNNAAVGYHFGTSADLVEAIVERHTAAVEQLRAQQLVHVKGSGDIYDWVDCLVRPTAQHLQDLQDHQDRLNPGNPTWYARLSAQLATDPRRHALVVERALRSPALRTIVEGLQGCLPDLPAAVRAERNAAVRLLSVHVFAERESALAEGRAPARASWAECADGLVDALVGLWLAPVNRRSAQPSTRS